MNVPNPNNFQYIDRTRQWVSLKSEVHISNIPSHRNSMGQTPKKKKNAWYTVATDELTAAKLIRYYT